jgi:PAS domain S-box-containing protein
MKQKSTPIQRKLMKVIMLTCGTVLILTCAAFFIYEFITYRGISRRELSTLGGVIAANSTSSLAFDDKRDADEILNSLRAQPHIVAACLYDRQGKIFAYYPGNMNPDKLPKTVYRDGYSFEDDFIYGYEPVVQGNDRVGTLYLQSDMKDVYRRFLLYGLIAALFIGISIIIAYLISKRMQRTISLPILELAQTASVVSDKRDYSVRARKHSNDEVGTLTDAFNHMLTEIQAQSEEIKALNVGLEEKVALRTNELKNANLTLTQQNEFIQAIIDSSVDVIAVFDKELRYVMLNKTGEHIYKGKKEDLIGRKILDVFPTLQGSEMFINLQKALEGQTIHHDAYKSPLTGRYFQNFFIPLKDNDGAPDRILVIGHDITNIMQANEKLTLVNVELEKSNRELEQFAYVASHDLQEPLRKIQTFSELSEKNIQYPEILKRYLQKINSSASRMSELIKAVLNYSRLAISEKDFTAVDLNAILANIKTDLELLIEEKKATITATQLPVLWANPLQIHQLFLNLISNSLKFSERSPHVNISAKVVSSNEVKKSIMPKQAGNYLELTFMDNGIGFEQEYAEQIFGIFQRLHSQSDYAGTGIGLALCKKIIENHGGLIAVESQPNKGTCFYIYFPATLLHDKATASHRNILRY